MQQAPDDRGRQIGPESALPATGGGYGRDARAAPPDGDGPGRGARLVRIRDHCRPAGAGRELRRGRSRRRRLPARRPGGEHPPRLPRRRRPLHRVVCRAPADRAAGARRDTVAAFLAAEAGRGLAVNTLRLRHAALRYLHLLAGYPPPTASPLVSATFAGIRRAHRRPLRKKTALMLDPLRAAVQQIPDTLPGLRDRALLLVGFAAALRPSELAALTCEHLTRHEDGIALFLPWRKNDQEAHGTNRLAAGRARPICARSEPSRPGSPPLKSPRARCSGGCGDCRRRACAGARSAKPVADRYRIGTNPIDTNSIALVVKKWTGLAGLDGAAFAGHSLRRGCHLERRRPRRPHRAPQAVLRPRLAEELGGICRARRIAAKPSAEGRALKT